MVAVYVTLRPTPLGLRSDETTLVVGAPATTWESDPELVGYDVVPENVATIALAPDNEYEVWQVALPVFVSSPTAVQMAVPALVNVTVPPVGNGVTVAVNVTAEPAATGLTLEVTTVVVLGASLVVWVVAALWLASRVLVPE
jgi:hypothetical protein